MPLVEQEYTAKDYWELPEGRRAELIGGELWDLASPSRLHQEIVQELARGIGNHISYHHGRCKVYPAPFAVNLFADDSTFVEPDISVVCDRDRLSDRGCEGAPDLVVEVVSPSSVGMDYVSKLSLYRDAGVREYWVADPLEGRTVVYVFGDEPLMRVYPFSEPVPSVVLEGLSIDFGKIASEL